MVVGHGITLNINKGSKKILVAEKQTTLIEMNSFFFFLMKGKKKAKTVPTNMVTNVDGP